VTTRMWVQHIRHLFWKDSWLSSHLFFHTWVRDSFPLARCGRCLEVSGVKGFLGASIMSPLCSSRTPAFSGRLAYRLRRFHWFYHGPQEPSLFRGGTLHNFPINGLGSPFSPSFFWASHFGISLVPCQTAPLLQFWHHQLLTGVLSFIYLGVLVGWSHWNGHSHGRPSGTCVSWTKLRSTHFAWRIPITSMDSNGIKMRVPMWANLFDFSYGWCLFCTASQPDRQKTGTNRTIGNAQKTEVLMGAELGGFIRWHGLATLDGSLFSSTYRNNCEGLFSVMVRFEVSSAPGTSSAATDS
jgi:hypothetical protein